MFYIAIILISNVIIAGASFLAGEDYFSALLESALATVCVIAIDGVFAFLIRRLPDKLFDAKANFWAVSKKEARIYRGLKINKWKKLIPELGGFTSFHKDKLQSTTDEDYLARFILESNYGVAIHIANAITGILLFLLPFSASIVLPVAIVNAVLSLLPVMILRSNLPALHLLYRKTQKNDR